MTIAEIVGIYAAIIASILAIKEIYLIITKLKVSYTFFYKFVTDNFGNQVGPGEYVLSLELVNQGKPKRIIKGLYAKLPKKIDNMQAISIMTPGKYPITLNEGQVFQKEISLVQFLNAIKKYNLDDEKSIKFVFHDTLGKKYWTKGIKIKTIKEFADMKANND